MDEPNPVADATMVPTPISIYLDKRFTERFHPSYSPVYKLALLTVLPINPEDSKGHLGDIFSSLNDPGKPLVELSREWRAKGNRSLSVCDVVVIGETAFRCEPSGWSVLDPSLIAAHTPIEGE